MLSSRQRTRPGCPLSRGQTLRTALAIFPFIVQDNLGGSMKSTLMIGMGLVALQALGAVPAIAQDAAPEGASEEGDADTLPSIVVTAQRRSEDVQKAALSITAVSGREIERRGLSSTEELGTLTAGLQVNPSAGPYTTFSVRSVSSLSGNAFADPAVAANINGVYLATPTVIHGLYYDLERVEILKGPQGTLYGRNATAGAINIIPNRPKFTFGASASADIGNFDRVNVGGMLNVPLSDTVAFRVAGQRVRRDGFMSDGTSDDKGEAVRASLLFEPGDDLSILLTGDFAHQEGKGPGATLRKSCALLGRPGAACFVADPYTAASDLPDQYIPFGLAPQTKQSFVDGDYYGAGLNIDWTTGLGTVSFVGGYRESKNSYKGSGTSWLLLEAQEPKQASAELRLASTGEGRLQYVLGAYYLDTEMTAHANSENSARANFSDQYTSLDGWTAAAFSQLTFSLTDTLRATGGLRYTYEEKSSDSRRYTLANTLGPDPVIPDEPVGAPVNVVVGSRHWDKVNWKLGFEYDVAPRSLLYANVSTGFKAGGFFYGPPGAQSYEPETVTSYVIGSKNRLLGNRLQLNAEGFYLDYRDQQVAFVKLIGTSATLVTENAGKSRAYGFELEGDFLATPNTRIGTQIQHLQAKYDSFTYLTIAPPGAASTCLVSPPVAGQFTVDCAGNTPLRSPRWTLVGSIEQTFPLSNGSRFVGEARARHETAFQGDVAYLPETKTYDTTRVDLGVSFVTADDRFTIKAYVDNLTDEETISNVTTSVTYANNPVVGINLQAPRTYGVRALFNF
jgi:iron complex outermembrane receptor protein